MSLPHDFPARRELFLSLAPMDGVTDVITRSLLTDYAGGASGIDLCTSEFVRVTRDPVPKKVLLRSCPELAQGGRTPAGVPVTVQLLGGDPEPMAESAARAASLGAPGIDLNFGCPAKTVNRHDGGATLLKYPERLRTIVAAVRDAVPPEVPVSVKLRTGWDNSEDAEILAEAAQVGGGAWVTIHGRTRMDMYKPPADHRPIARARARVSVPVIANGDLCGAADLARIRNVTGCSAFMIGRGAMARPWLFRSLRGLPEDGLPAFVDLLHDFAARLIASGAEDRRALGRLKNWLCLSAKVDATVERLFQCAKRERTLGALLSRVACELARGQTTSTPSLDVSTAAHA